MLARVLLAGLVAFTATAFAAAEPKPIAYKLGMMSFNEDIGLSKRQTGYQPTFGECGEGDTCAIACGPGSATCVSSDTSVLHCFTPQNQTCCPNLSGHACDEGYYCTQDSNDETWCCQDGTSLAECAAQYQVSALVSLSGSAAATSYVAAASSTIIPYPAVTTSTSIYTLPIITGPPVYTSTSTPVVTYAPTASYNTTSTFSSATPTISSFKGAAGKHDAFGLDSALAMGVVALIAAF